MLVCVSVPVDVCVCVSVSMSVRLCACVCCAVVYCVLAYLLYQAQYHLGSHYFHGKGGLKKDLTKAVHFYTLAADQGVFKAQYQLAVCYEKGVFDQLRCDPCIAFTFKRIRMIK